MISTHFPKSTPRIGFPAHDILMERRLAMASKQATTIRGVYGKTEDRYLDLIRRFPRRPLCSDADLYAAVAIVDDLIDRARGRLRSCIGICACQRRSK